MTNLDLTYQALCEFEIVSSQYDFSTYWLGQNRSYYSALKSHDRDASAQVLATVRARIQSLAASFRYADRSPTIYRARSALVGEAYRLNQELQKRDSSPIATSILA